MAPFFQHHWPLPPRIPFMPRDEGSELVSVVEVGAPFKQSDWPLPPRRRVSVLREGSRGSTPDAIVPVVVRAFAQTDWPIPRQRLAPPPTWVSTLANFPTPDDLPFGQTHWPLPAARRTVPGLHTITVERKTYVADTAPFFLTEWPLPQPMRAADLRTWTNDGIRSDPQPPLRPYEWTIPLGMRPLTLSWTAPRYQELVDPVADPFIPIAWEVIQRGWVSCVTYSPNLTLHLPVLAANLFRGDTGTDDGGDAFEAYVLTRALVINQDLGKLGHANEPVLQGKARAATSLTVTYNREFDKETRAQTVSIAASAAAEYRVVRRVEALELADMSVLQVKIGDAAATTNTWALDRCDIPVETDGDR